MRARKHPRERACIHARASKRERVYVHVRAQASMHAQVRARATGVRRVAHSRTSYFVHGVRSFVLSVYPGVSARIFQLYACRRFGDSPLYLEADLAVECDWTQGGWGYGTFAVLGLFAVLLYVVGVPAFLALYLLRKRKAIRRLWMWQQEMQHEKRADKLCKRARSADKGAPDDSSELANATRDDAAETVSPDGVASAPSSQDGAATALSGSESGSAADDAESSAMSNGGTEPAEDDNIKPAEDDGTEAADIKSAAERSQATLQPIEGTATTENEADAELLRHAKMIWGRAGVIFDAYKPRWCVPALCVRCQLARPPTHTPSLLLRYMYELWDQLRKASNRVLVRACRRGPVRSAHTRR